MVKKLKYLKNFKFQQFSEADDTRGKFFLFICTTELKRPGLEVIKKFSRSTQLSMNFFLLINVKMPTIVGILTFMNRKNSILGLTESEKCCIS